MESFPNFIKLWGSVSAKLTAGEQYVFKIVNEYDVSEFNGEKHIYLSTTNSFGGTNVFLGEALIVFGGICVFVQFIFCMLYFFKLKGQDMTNAENLDW
jgi:hypothetical protein